MLIHAKSCGRVQRVVFAAGPSRSAAPGGQHVDPFVGSNQGNQTWGPWLGVCSEPPLHSGRSQDEDVCQLLFVHSSLIRFEDL